MSATSRDQLAEDLAAGGASQMARQIVEIGTGIIAGALVLRRFGASEFGVLAVAQALIAIVFLGTMNVESGLERLLPEYAAQNDAARVWSALAIAYVGRVGGAALLAAGLIGATHWWPTTFRSAAVIAVLPGLALGSVFGAAGGNALITLIAYRRYGLSLVLSGLAGVLGILIAAWTLLAGLSLPRFVALSAGASVIVGLLGCVLTVMIVPQPMRLTRAALRDVRNRTIRYSGPLFGSRVVFEIYRNVGQLLLGYLGAFAGAGLFTFAKGVLEKVVAIATSFHGAALPLLAREARDHGRIQAAVLALSRAATVLGGLAAAGMFVLAPEAVRLLGGPSFAGAVWVLRAFALQAFARIAVQPYWTLMYVRDETWFILWASVARLAIEVVLLIALLPHFGLWGAVVAQIAGFVASPAILFWWARRRLQVPVRAAIRHLLVVLLTTAVVATLLLPLPVASTLSHLLLWLPLRALVTVACVAIAARRVGAIPDADLHAWLRLRVGGLSLDAMYRRVARWCPALPPLPHE